MVWAPEHDSHLAPTRSLRQVEAPRRQVRQFVKTETASLLLVCAYPTLTSSLKTQTTYQCLSNPFHDLEPRGDAINHSGKLVIFTRVLIVYI